MRRRRKSTAKRISPDCGRTAAVVEAVAAPHEGGEQERPPGLLEHRQPERRMRERRMLVPRAPELAVEEADNAAEAALAPDKLELAVPRHPDRPPHHLPMR